MKFLFLCHVLPALILADEQPFGSAAGTFRIAMDVFDTTLSWASKSFGVMDLCPYVDDPVTSLAEHLPGAISGQDQGVEMILDTFSSWEFSRKAGYQQPLVLAITGPTGVGKSETGFLIAEAILSTRTRIGTSRRHMPEGYLVLGGQDYSNTSDAFVGENNGLPEVHRRINVRITDHLRKCGGNAVIVFDEIQKVVPGTLDILMGGLKERGEFRVHSKAGAGAGAGSEGLEVFSSEGVVMILTSDIGAAEMESLLLAYENRELIPQQILRTEVKKALDKQWERLQFGSVVSEVIPYMPLEQRQIEQIMTLKLGTMAEEYRHMYWLDLCVEQSVIQALSRPPFVQYRSRKVTMTMSNGSRIPREKTMAIYGARGIDNGGPLQDLKTSMYKHMQPWKKGSVLHISVRGFDPLKSSRQDPEIVLTWCSVDISMTPLPAERPASAGGEYKFGSSGNVGTLEENSRGASSSRFKSNVGGRVGHYYVREKHLRSPLCEERWSGTLLDRSEH